VIRRVDATNLSGILLAVADGHGGDETSSYVAQQLSDGLFDMMVADNKNLNDALKTAFQYLNDSTLELSKKTFAHYESGTTLSVVYIPDGQDKLHIGIIGDSPVIVARMDGKFHISPEHNARSNEEERKAAEQRGGLFSDGYLHSPSTRMGLQMTRDIGCHAMGNVLRRYPDIYDFAIHDGDVLIVASDGLLDPAHSSTDEDVRRLTKLVLEGAEAQELIDDALRRQTGDNVSAVVYRH
jgi:serine/threonine protein phosphatase PrpC